MKAEELLKRYAAGERNFAGVRFLYGSVAGSTFCEIDLRDIILSGAYLAHLQFRETDLSGAKMVGAYLVGSRLYMADLSGADLTGANLTGAYLGHTNLRGADLTGANLTKAILAGADMTRTILTGANLSRVDMSKIKLYGIPSRDFMFFVPEDTFLWQTTMPDGTFEELPRYYDVGY